MGWEQRQGATAVPRGPVILCIALPKKPASNPAHSSQMGKREGRETDPEIPHHLESTGCSLVPQKEMSSHNHKVHKERDPLSNFMN